LAYNSDDGFIYTMTTDTLANDVFERYSITGDLDSTLLTQPPSPVPKDLVSIGGDQLIGIAASSLYQYNIVADSWSTLTSTLTSFNDPSLAFDFGVLYAVDSGSDRLFTIDLTNAYAVNTLGVHVEDATNGGGLSTTCMSKYTLFQCYQVD
jgi:hypothetical protein